MNPKVLVLDDATSAIDVQLEQEIHAALRRLMKGRTTLIVAHRLSTIRLADRVALLDKTRIVATGTHEQLMLEVAEYADILRRAEADSRAAALAAAAAAADEEDAGEEEPQRRRMSSGMETSIDPAGLRVPGMDIPEAGS